MPSGSRRASTGASPRIPGPRAILGQHSGSCHCHRCFGSAGHAQVAGQLRGVAHVGRTAAPEARALHPFALLRRCEEGHLRRPEPDEVSKRRVHCSLSENSEVFGGETCIDISAGIYVVGGAGLSTEGSSFFVEVCDEGAGKFVEPSHGVVGFGKLAC
jgi:hypothetical protein